MSHLKRETAEAAISAQEREALTDRALPRLLPGAGQVSSAQSGMASIPEAGKPYLHILVHCRLDGESGIRRALRTKETMELRQMAAHVARCQRLTPHILEALGLPQLDGPGFWVGQVLPAVKRELQRRERPQVLTRSGSPIAKLKALDITQVAERFTKLKPAGSGKYKGLCPLHSEKTASFYIYEDSRRWRCFGACATGGDVIDLLERLSAQGALT